MDSSDYNIRDQSMNVNNNESEPESEIEEKERQFNKFQLLNLVSDDDDGDKNENSQHSRYEKDDDDESEDEKAQQKNQKSKGRNSKRRTRKKSESSKGNGVSENSKANNTRKRRRGKGAQVRKDVLDATIEEQLRIINSNQNLKKTATRNPASLVSEAEQKWIKRLEMLRVEYKNLNPKNELRRMFGRKTIENEIGTRGGRSRLGGAGSSGIASRNHSSSLIDNDEDSAPISRVGFTMTLDDIVNQEFQLKTLPCQSQATAGSKMEDSNRLEEDKPKSDGVPKDVQYFKFLHKKSYQEAQFKFLDAAERGDTSSVIATLQKEPSHVDTLIQISDVISRTTEDYKNASELIERALAIFQSSFHIGFNLTQARCRLDYRRPENRSFFIAIFKHISYLGRRGLKRTPLEFTKVLLALEPENDPLAAALLIDYYAIRSEEYDFLIDFANKWDQLKILPNLRFSVALAMHLRNLDLQRKRIKQNKSRKGIENPNQAADLSQNSEESDKKLKEALIQFPNFLSPLFELCKIEPDAEFKRCSYFNYGPAANKKVPEAVHVLVRLYVARTNMIWKTKEAMNWLERNATQLAREIESGELKNLDDPNKYWSLAFKTSAPRSLLRHLVLSPDLPSEIVSVPPSAAATPILDIDPFPPQNQIISYTRPPRQSNRGTANFDAASPQSALRLFFRSIIPDFESHAAAIATAGSEHGIDITHLARDLNDGLENGADISTLRRSVNGLMYTLRGILEAVEGGADGGGDEDETDYETEDALD